MSKYSEKLKHPKWQKKRLEIMERDKFKCCLCDDMETTLHVHHLSYSGDPWDVENGDLVTLCEDCHNIVHELNEDNKNFDFIELELIKLVYPHERKIFFIRHRHVIMTKIFIEANDGYFELDIDSVSKINKLKNRAKKHIFDL